MASSKQRGEGTGCAAETNPLIVDLLERSRQNAAKYDKQDLARYNVNNFADYFKASYPPRIIVVHPTTGEYEALTVKEVDAQIKAGTIKTGSSGGFQDNFATRMEYYFAE